VDGEANARHPNDPSEVRRRLANDALSMSPRERRQLVAMIDTALGKLRKPRRPRAPKQS